MRLIFEVCMRTTTTITIGKTRLLYLKKWYYSTPNQHTVCPWNYITGGEPWQSQCCFKTCGKLFITAKEKDVCPCFVYNKSYVLWVVKRVLLTASNINTGKESTCQLGSERAKRIG